MLVMSVELPTSLSWSDWVDYLRLNITQEQSYFHISEENWKLLFDGGLYRDQIDLDEVLQFAGFVPSRGALH
jgi:hypothetical protein